MTAKTLYIIITYLSLLVFLMALVPFLQKGIPSGHDIMSHLIYLKKFQDAFFQGQFPVRFNDWFVPGFNQPLSNFYQPGFYYIFLIPKLIGIPNTEALKITVLFLWVLSGLFMYLFTKRHFGRLGGILGAAFYMFAPYHIEDLVVRAAFSEFAALAFAPGIFWAVKTFYDTKKKLYLSLIAIFIALVVICHPPTLIMYIPILVGYVGYLFFRGDVHLSPSVIPAKLVLDSDRGAGIQSVTQSSLNFLLSISLSFLLSFGLLSFFVLPALFEQKYIQVIYMQSGYYDFRNHFVCLTQPFVPNWGYGLSTTGCQDGMSFQIGLVHLLAIGMVIYFLVERLLRLQGETLQARKVSPLSIHFLFLSFLAFYIYMLFEISLPFWENLPFVPFIQYSWRFLAVIMFITSFLAASIPEFFSPVIARSPHSSGQRSNPIGLRLLRSARNDKREKSHNDKHKYLAFAILILLLPTFYIWYLRPSTYFAKDQLNFDSPNFLQGIKPETGNLLPETGFMPKWAQVMPPIDELPENEAKILNGDAQIENARLTAHKKEYTIIASSFWQAKNERVQNLHRDAGQASMTRIRFYTHYFPGWKVYMDQKPHDFSYDNIYGYIDVAVEKGTHKVVLSFEDTPIRTTGNLISLISLIGLIGLIGSIRPIRRILPI